MRAPAFAPSLGLAALLAIAGCHGEHGERGEKGNAAAGDASGAPSASAAPSASGGPVNMTPVPTASVAAVLGADRLPAYAGPTGSFEGTIYVTGEPAPDVHEDFSKCPDAEKTYGKLFREGAPKAPGVDHAGRGADVPSGARPLADALVGVIGYSGFYIPEKREARLVTIEDCAFTQRTVDLTFGQRLDVENKTNKLLAPALSGIATPALMVATPGGDPVHLYPPKPGYYKLTERFEAAPLKADVYVLTHPLHAVTDLNGHYRIDGVPVGMKLTVFTRLASIGETATETEALAGVVKTVDLTLKYAPKDAGPPAPRRDAGPILK